MYGCMLFCTSTYFELMLYACLYLMFFHTNTLHHSYVQRFFTYKLYMQGTHSSSSETAKTKQQQQHRIDIKECKYFIDFKIFCLCAFACVCASKYLFVNFDECRVEIEKKNKKYFCRAPLYYFCKYTLFSRCVFINAKNYGKNKNLKA